MSEDPKGFNPAAIKSESMLSKSSHQKEAPIKAFGSLVFGGIELSGTKTICGIGNHDGEILVEKRIPTTNPADVLSRCVDFFEEQSVIFGDISAIGIASFGPVGLRAKFGQILRTPKEGWSNTDIVSPFREAFNVPIGFDTDVNGAALGEWRWGAAQGLDTFVYFTIGTGIGGGGMINGELMHGLSHPEMGHIPLPNLRPERFSRTARETKSELAKSSDKENALVKPFGSLSVCPFHDDCFEGLASGPAIEKRWGSKAENLDVEHSAWEVEASLIARAMRSVICTISPQRIILGGGVMEQSQLFPLIREKTLAELNNYMELPKMDEYIVPVALDGNAGILGAFILAERALKTL